MKININGNEVEVADADLTAAIEAKQASIEVTSELVIRTAADDKTFADNTRTEGISVGSEVGRKEVLKGFGIEGDGLHKSGEKSIAAIKTFADGLVSTALADAKIEPNKKNAELMSDITTLRGTIETQTKTIETKDNEFKTFKNKQLISSSLSNEVPENTLNSKQDTLTLMNSKINLGVNENGIVFGIGVDGNPMKDPATLELLPVKSIVSKFFNDNSQLLKASSGGGSGGDSGGGDGKQSIDDFIKEMEEVGKAANGPEFNAEMNLRIKAGTLAI